MKLNVKERLILPRLLPQNGGYHDLVTIRGVISKVEVSEKEMKEMGVTRAPNGSLEGLTREKEEKEVGVDFTAEEVDIVAKQLKEFEKAQTLNVDILRLFELFVGAPEEKTPESNKPKDDVK